MKGDGAAPPGADFTGCLWNAPFPGSPSRSLDPNSEMGWRAAPFRSSGDGTGVVARETWQARRQHPVQLVESFVDETQCRGTCYRACGFEAVGLTKGFARASRDFYREHGVPKQLCLRELRPDARRLLRQARWPAARVPTKLNWPDRVPSARRVRPACWIVSAPCPVPGRLAGCGIAAFRPDLRGDLNAHGRVRLSRLREHLQTFMQRRLRARSVVIYEICFDA